MEIIVFNESDAKKSGGFKKKNNIKTYGTDEFVKHIKENNLSVSKGYIDSTGFISDNSRFKCYYKGIIVGVTSIIDTIQGVEK